MHEAQCSKGPGEGYVRYIVYSASIDMHMSIKVKKVSAAPRSSVALALPMSRC